MKTLYYRCVLAVIGLVASGASFAAAEVNVYSYRQPFLITPMFDAFTRSTGIKVNVVFARQGLVERVRREGRNSPADLLITVDIGRLTDLYEGGLTQPARSALMDANIPPQYRGPDGHYYGLTARARIAVLSKTRAADITALSYEDLALPKFRGRICTRSAKHAYMVALTASMIVHHGEAEAARWLQGLKSNLARKPQGNDRAQVKAIKEGVCDVALINNYYMAQMLRDPDQAAWAEAVNVIFPNQADRGTHLNVSGVALAAHAPNRDNAIKLMEFLSGAVAQQMYAEQNAEYPLNPGVSRSSFLRSLGDFKADDLALDAIAAKRNAASKLADRVGYDG